MKEKLLDYLKIQPLARERKNKDRACINLLVKSYPSLAEINPKILVSFVQDYGSMDRYWRQILLEQPELRGSDYDDKKILSQEKVLELGYEVGIRKI